LLSCSKLDKKKVFVNNNCIEEYYIRDNKKDFDYKSFYLSGKLHIHYTLKNGLRQGYYLEYYENGNFKIICFYKNNTLNGYLYKFYENGNIRFVSFFVNGFNEKKSYSYYENKNPKIISNFHKSYEEGPAYCFYPSYFIERYSYFVNGKQLYLKRFKKDGTVFDEQGNYLVNVYHQSNDMIYYFYFARPPFSKNRIVIAEGLEDKVLNITRATNIDTLKVLRKSKYSYFVGKIKTIDVKTGIEKVQKFSVQDNTILEHNK
jgi:antitoxin component YwqK of YwqJK toxin-antitoxin module